MLVPVEEPRPMADAGCSDSPSQRGPDPRGACAVGAAPGRSEPAFFNCFGANVKNVQQF